MSSFIIGTAGHIDHGKSALIKALTNIETDRFQEEKDRGITIDLGFAYLDLDDHKRVGIVDVPGHEKFIKNMLAGVSGIDLVLLIVSAEESVMPQTREHIDILRFLDIEDGIICITKADLVEDDFIELVKEEIKESVEGTFLEDAPMITTSAVTKEGLTQLIELIEEKYDIKKRGSYTKDFRLPIDRAFTLKGLGTIITGTLVEGQIEKGESLEIFPSHLKTKARGIQVHNEDVESAHAGQRVAINIPGISKEEIERGDVIAPVDRYQETNLIDVEFTTLQSTERVITNNMRLRLYIGTSEVMCRISILNQEMILPGDTVFAQLKLEESIICKYDDKFVIRFYSPLETIGGGKILRTKTSYHKRFNDEINHGLEIIAQGNYQEIIEYYLSKHFFQNNTLENILKNTGLSKSNTEQALNELTDKNRVVLIKDQYFLIAANKNIEKDMIKYLQNYHNKNHLSQGINKEELRKVVFNNLDKGIFDQLLKKSEEEHVISVNGSIISLYDFTVTYNPTEKKLYDKIENYYLECGYNPKKLNEVIQSLDLTSDNLIIIENLYNDDKLVRLNQDIVLHNKWVEASKALIQKYIQENSSITLGEFRDLVDSSRKIILPLLDYFDQIGFTKRVEDKRVLKGE